MSAGQHESVLYSPPKGVGFGHQARIRDARRAWKLVVEFLDQWTVSHLEPHIRLDCYGPQESTNSEVAAQRAEAARSLFGSEKNPSDIPRHTKQWELNPDQLEVAISFVLDDDKYPKQELGPTSLFFRYSFQWQEYPGANSSQLGVILGSQRLFWQPSLSFPLPHESQALRAFLRSIEPALPFRIRDQYFKRLLPARGNGHGTVRKLPSNWRQPNNGLQPTLERG